MQKKETARFQARGDDEITYWVVELTTIIQQSPLSGVTSQRIGGKEYRLHDGGELFNVSGQDNQWDIASTNVRITKI